MGTVMQAGFAHSHISHVLSLNMKIIQPQGEKCDLDLGVEAETT